MFKRGDENATTLLHIITEESLACSQVYILRGFSCIFMTVCSYFVNSLETKHLHALHLVLNRT